MLDRTHLSAVVKICYRMCLRSVLCFPDCMRFPGLGPTQYLVSSEGVGDFHEAFLRVDFSFEISAAPLLDERSVVRSSVVQWLMVCCDFRLLILDAILVFTENCLSG